jgi:hypothetical protein
MPVPAPSSVGSPPPDASPASLSASASAPAAALVTESKAGAGGGPHGAHGITAIGDVVPTLVLLARVPVRVSWNERQVMHVWQRT